MKDLFWTGEGEGRRDENYLVELLEWFVEIDQSDDQREDLLGEPSDMTDHEAPFESHEDNNEKRRPQTDTASHGPEIGLQRLTELKTNEFRASDEHRETHIVDHLFEDEKRSGRSEDQQGLSTDKTEQEAVDRRRNQHFVHA